MSKELVIYQKSQESMIMLHSSKEVIPIAILSANLMVLLHEIEQDHPHPIIDFQTNITMAVYCLRELDKDLAVRNKLIEELGDALDKQHKEYIT